ncbi:response regulator transcription factor [bacterium]|jgi:DNA-binding response OmpR family regulator|nr:response regulator transcription factor [bacterium]
MAKILVVEDDRLVAQAVVDALKFAQHIVECVDDGKEGLDRLLLYQYDIAILDLNLPSMTGIEIARNYRASGGMLPLLMLTGRGDISDKESGFDSGVDDYLTKPFDVRELIARVRVLLRRPQQTLPDLITIGNLSLNVREGTATFHGKEVRLLKKERTVLEFLMRHPNQIFSVQELLNRLWSSESDSSEDAVRQCIARLRSKLSEGENTGPIVTVKGLGYKIADANPKL